MTVFLQSVLSGILVGGVYALIGIGLTIINDVADQVAHFRRHAAFRRP